MAGILNCMFSLNHLFRQGTYRDDLLQAIGHVLHNAVELDEAEAPPDCALFLHEFFQHTLLRNSDGASMRSSSRRGSPGSERSFRVQEIVRQFCGVFKGFRTRGGKLRIFLGGRALSRQAVISNLLDKWTLLCFDSIPATPAENKWLTLSPMIAWTIVTFCLFFHRHRCLPHGV